MNDQGKLLRLQQLSEDFLNLAKEVGIPIGTLPEMIQDIYRQLENNPEIKDGFDSAARKRLAHTILNSFTGWKGNKNRNLILRSYTGDPEIWKNVSLVDLPKLDESFLITIKYLGNEGIREIRNLRIKEDE